MGKTQTEKLVELIYDKDKSLLEMDALAKSMIKEEYLTVGFWQSLALERIMECDGEVKAGIFFFNPNLEYKSSFEIYHKYNTLLHRYIGEVTANLVAETTVIPGEDYDKKAMDLIEASEYKRWLNSRSLSIALCLKANDLTRYEYDEIYSHFSQFLDALHEGDATSNEIFAKIIEIYKMGYNAYKERE